MKKRNLLSVRNAVLRQDLASFIRKSFHTINPGTSYQHNWHINLMAEALMESWYGRNPRMIINIPPRSLKSLCVSVAWPAWILGHDPSARIIVASYAHALSQKHALDCRAIMQSPWYRHIFPATRIMPGQNTKEKFMTTQHGHRLATSIGGSLTGEGGNYLILDDPHLPSHTSSSLRRSKAVEWFEHTFMSRLDDKKKGVVMVVMQRLHEGDITGYLLQHKAKYWHHLCLPAIA